MHENQHNSDSNFRKFIAFIQFSFALYFMLSDTIVCQTMDNTCSSYIPSLSNISLCTADSCRYNQVVKLPQPNVRGTTSCFKIQHQGFDQVFKITTQASFDYITFDYCYVTGDNTISYSSYCGCPLGSTVTCNSCPQIDGYYDYNSCYIGTHTSHQCLLDYLPGVKGLFCTKEFISNNRDTLVCKVNKAVSYNTELQVQYLDFNTTINVNTPIRSFVHPNYTIDILYNYKASSLPDFVIWHTHDDNGLFKKGVYEADSIVVNDINSCDRNKIGWFKPYQNPPVCEVDSFKHYDTVKVVNCNKNKVDIISQNISVNMAKFFKPSNFIIHNTGGFGYKNGQFMVSDMDGGITNYSIGFLDFSQLTILDNNRARKVNEFTLGIATFENSWGTRTKVPQPAGPLTVSAHNLFTGINGSSAAIGLGLDGSMYTCLNPILSPPNTYVCQPVAGVPPVFFDTLPDHTRVLLTYAGYRTFEKNELTEAERPSDSAVLELTIRLDNITIQFQQKFTIGSLEKVEIKNGYLIVTARSLTETGDCYISAPTLLQTNPGIILTKENKTFEFYIDRFNNEGTHNVSLTCYNNVQSKDVYYNQSLAVEPIQENESFWESLIPDTNDSIGGFSWSLFKLIAFIIALIIGIILFIMLIPIFIVLFKPALMAGKWLWSNRVILKRNTDSKRMEAQRLVRKYLK